MTCSVLAVVGLLLLAAAVAAQPGRTVTSRTAPGSELSQHVPTQDPHQPVIGWDGRQLQGGEGDDEEGGGSRKHWKSPRSSICCQTSVQYSNGQYKCNRLTSPVACLANNYGNYVIPGKRCLPCPSCCPIGYTCGDPHVTGFDGSSYLLYGKTNTTYNLISECTHQINVRLYQPPSLATGHALFIQAVGLALQAARVSVELTPAHGTTAAAMAVTVNGGKPFVYPGYPYERAIDFHTAFVFESVNSVVIYSTAISISVRLIDNDHLDVGVEEVVTNWHDVHGIMGQTYAKAFNIKYNYQKAEALGHHPGTNARIKADLKLQGTEDDYIVSSLFASDFKYNRLCGPDGKLAQLSQKSLQQQQAVAPAFRKMLQRHGGGSGPLPVERGSSAADQQWAKTVAGVTMTAPELGVAQVAPQRKLLKTTYYSCQ